MLGVVGSGREVVRVMGSVIRMVGQDSRGVWYL